MASSATPTTPRFGKTRNMTQVIYTGMMASLVVLSGVVYALMGNIPIAEKLPPIVLFVAGAALSAFCVAMAFVLPKTMVDRIPPHQVALRLNGYAYSRIMIAGLLEAAGLFWAIVALLTTEPLCLAGPALAIFALAAWFPTQNRIEQELQMTEPQVDRALGYSD